MSLNFVGSFPIGAINVAASGAVALVAPLFAELDLALFGAFGLGPLQADLRLQFKAALDAEVSLGIQISDPFASLQALANLLASLQLGLPTIALQATAALSANLAISAALAAKLGGIQALIEAALAVKAPAIQFMAALQAALSAGPVDLLSFGIDSSGNPVGTDTLALVGSAVQAQFSAGLPGGTPILPGDPVFGIILVTKTPGARAALMATLKAF